MLDHVFPQGTVGEPRRFGEVGVNGQRPLLAPPVEKGRYEIVDFKVEPAVAGRERVVEIEGDCAASQRSAYPSVSRS